MEILLKKLLKILISEENINQNDSFKCPFCNSTVAELSEKMKQIELCKRALNDSLNSISFIKNEYLEEEKLKIDKEIDTYKEIQSKLRKNIKELKEKDRRIQENLDFKDLIIKKKIRIEEDLDRIGLCKLNKDEEIVNISNEVDEINEKLYGYDLDKELNKIENMINSFMNKMAEKLDFENQYRPIDLRFDSRSFDLYQHQKKDKENVFLSSMGSGSNWLTCHLSLFTALQYCFAKLGESCSIPKILILDQPSQIYFPSFNNQDNKDIDIISVENIYSALEWAVEYIFEETGEKIQVIVLDHASGLEFNDKKFDDFIIRRWNEKGNGLIEKSNIQKKI